MQIETPKVLVRGLVLLGTAMSLLQPLSAATPAEARKALDLANPDVRAIVQTAADFAEAFNSGDIDRVMGFYSEDVVYMAQGRPSEVGRASLKQARQALFSSYRLHVEVQVEEVEVWGNIAFDRATFTLSASPKSGGDSILTRGRLLEVLKKQEGRWKSWRVMSNIDVVERPK